MSNYGPKRHLIDRSVTPGRIACGKTAGLGGYTLRWQDACCYDCAREASGLSPSQRNHIWQNENDRLDKERKTLWPDAKDPSAAELAS